MPATMQLWSGLEFMKVSSKLLDSGYDSWQRTLYVAACLLVASLTLCAYVGW